ncbi:MAG TPA: amino acid adenylation domain-containing protein [Blastocatellia bacterium]|nr:amino acid adenylation domain-containing protein [Blastocatellia bacterium]
MAKEIEDIYPLSPMQQGMLFHTLYAPQAGAYFIQQSYEITGRLDAKALREAWEKVVERHPILRTAFAWEGRSKPLQVVYQRVPLPWQEQDWTAMSGRQEQESRLLNLLEDDRRKGFDATKAPLMRLVLIKLDRQEHRFIWSFHHALMDGWSVGLVLKEVFAIYQSICDGAPAQLGRRRPYKEYIAWLRRQDGDRAEEYWRKELEGIHEPTRLGIDGSPASSPSQEETYRSLQTSLDESLMSGVNRLARRYQLTANTIMEGAWAILMSRYSGKREVVFGATVSGRPPDLPDAGEMVGLFINTLPVRVDVAPDETVADWLRELQARQVESRLYEYSPLVEVAKHSKVQPGSPLFESIFVFENFPVDSALSEGPPHLRIRQLYCYDWVHYPIAIAAAPGAVKVLYDYRLFSDKAIRRLTGHYCRLIEEITSKAERKVSDLTMLTEAERRGLTASQEEPRRDFPPSATIHELFEAQVERTPEAIALVFGQERVSYRELNERANRLARHLRGLGVGPEEIVGIYMDRSVEMVTAIVAILKAGGAYLPIDLSYPQQRLQFMLADAGCRVVLTRDPSLDASPDGVRLIDCLGPEREAIAGQSPENLSIGGSPSGMAYVIYTSGSTGGPKGVAVTHFNVTRLLDATDDWFGLNERDVWTLFHSYAFDFSVWEMWGALLYGGRLVIVPYRVSRSPEAFYRLLESERVTVLNQTPSAFRQLIAAEENLGGPGDLALRLVIFGGEALDPRTLAGWIDRHGDRSPRLVNMYGITETTVHVTYRPITASDAGDGRGSVIGEPIPDLTLYILDESLEPAPLGVAGEIYVGGAGLARGYLNRPDLTAARFIPDPFSGREGERLYRSGDLGRRLSHVDVEYLGRIDQQVKIRGFRIELGEIEAALCSHDSVRESVVLAREDSQGNARLVAYVVASAPGVDVSELQSLLKNRLPEYMVPSSFAFLDKLPLTVNGKLDRRALPEPDEARPALAREFVAPRTPVEQEIADIWRDILGIANPGIYDNFFELGGHSMLVLQLATRIRKAFHVELPLAAIFDSPTIEGLTRVIFEQQLDDEDSEELANAMNDLRGLSAEEVRKALEAEGS